MQPFTALSLSRWQSCDVAVMSQDEESEILTIAT